MPQTTWAATQKATPFLASLRPSAGAGRSMTDMTAVYRGTRPPTTRNMAWVACRGRRASLCAQGHLFAQQFEDDRVGQRLEGGIDNIGRHADREPAIALAVAAFDQNPGRGSRAAIEDTHLV